MADYFICQMGILLIVLTSKGYFIVWTEINFINVSWQSYDNTIFKKISCSISWNAHPHEPHRPWQHSCFPLEPLLRLADVSNPDKANTGSQHSNSNFMQTGSSHYVLLLQSIIITSEWIWGCLHLHEMRSHYLYSKLKANWADDMYKIRNMPFLEPLTLC